MRDFGQNRTFGAPSMFSFLKFWEDDEDVRYVGGKCRDPLSGKVRDCATVAQETGVLGPGNFKPYESIPDLALPSIPDLALPTADKPPPNKLDMPPPNKLDMPWYIPMAGAAMVLGLGFIYFKNTEQP